MQNVFYVIFIILTALCILGVVFSFRKNKSVAFRTVLIILGLISFGALLIVPSGFYQVDSGEAAVLKHFGKAQEKVDAGLHWRFWISDEVVNYDLKTQEEKQHIDAYSLDAQSMTAELSVQFRVMPDKLLEINRTYGTLDVLKQKILSVVNDKSKVVLSGFSAMEIIEKRASLSKNVQDAISEIIENYFVEITMVAIEDISFNEAFENAVEQKMIAEQKKLQADYDKQTAIIKAEQELEVAKKAAEAELEKAKASAQAQIEIANAEAEKIRIKSVEVAKMLGFTIKEDGEIDMTGKTAEEIKVISDYLKYIEYLSIWDGKLPSVVGGDATTVYIPDPTK